MSDEEKLEELKRRMSALLEEVWALGGEAMRQSIMAAVAAPAIHMSGGKPMHFTQRIEMPLPHSEHDGKTDRAPRAPKGLAKEMITAALKTRAGQTLKEVQELVSILDPRVPAKTVYNQLRSHDEFMEVKGRWYLADDSKESADPHAMGTIRRDLDL